MRSLRSVPRAGLILFALQLLQASAFQGDLAAARDETRRVPGLGAAPPKPN